MDNDMSQTMASTNIHRTEVTICCNQSATVFHIKPRYAVSLCSSFSFWENYLENVGELQENFVWLKHLKVFLGNTLI